MLLEVLMRGRTSGVGRIVTEVFSDNRASLKMLHRLGPTTVEDSGCGVSEVVVESRPPLLRDPTHRHALRTRDQVCPWFS